LLDGLGDLGAASTASTATFKNTGTKKFGYILQLISRQPQQKPANWALLQVVHAGA
jgi:hypothetical protein